MKMNVQSSTQSILFIDDEEGVRRSVQRALKREPYHIYTAGDGREGIDVVQDHVEEIVTVVSDFKMPGLDGLETLKIIGGINPEITRIILTGYATMEAAIDATNCGIDGFLTKPFDNVELRAKIRDIWVRKHLRQFVSEQIYEEINKSPMSLKPRFHDVTILFSDIRNFTAMSQHVSPEALVDFLNSDYFTPMGDIAYQHQGALDKHIGDSVMVVIGPISFLSNFSFSHLGIGLAINEITDRCGQQCDDKGQKCITGPHGQSSRVILSGQWPVKTPFKGLGFGLASPVIYRVLFFTTLSHCTQSYHVHLLVPPNWVFVEILFEYCNNLFTAHTQCALFDPFHFLFFCSKHWSRKCPSQESHSISAF